MTRHLPASRTRNCYVEAYIERKDDAGDLAVALAFKPEASSERIATRKAAAQSVITRTSRTFA
jgi:hypothetical protein